MDFFHRVMHLNYADTMAKSVDPDQGSVSDIFHAKAFTSVYLYMLIDCMCDIIH